MPAVRCPPYVTAGNRVDMATRKLKPAHNAIKIRYAGVVRAVGGAVQAADVDKTCTDANLLAASTVATLAGVRLAPRSTSHPPLPSDCPFAAAARPAGADTRSASLAGSCTRMVLAGVDIFIAVGKIQTMR